VTGRGARGGVGLVRKGKNRGLGGTIKQEARWIPVIKNGGGLNSGKGGPTEKREPDKKSGAQGYRIHGLRHERIKKFSRETGGMRGGNNKLELG